MPNPFKQYGRLYSDEVVKEYKEIVIRTLLKEFTPEEWLYSLEEVMDSYYKHSTQIELVITQPISILLEHFKVSKETLDSLFTSESLCEWIGISKDDTIASKLLKVSEDDITIDYQSLVLKASIDETVITINGTMNLVIRGTKDKLIKHYTALERQYQERWEELV